MVNATSGAAATVWLNNAGQYTTVISYPAGSLTTGWTSIVHIGNNRMFLYRASDGLAALGVVGSNGNFTTQRSYQNVFGAGWSQIVYTEATGLFFYNKATGTGEVGTLDAQGGYRTKKLHKNLFSKEWTHIVYYFSSQTLVYYNRNNGSLAIGKLDSAGNHTTLKSYQYTSGWTTLVPMHGNLLLYNGSNGASDLAQISSTGEFTYRTRPGAPFSTGWTTIVYGF